MKILKRWIKELKRVRWPSSKTATTAFWKSVIFVTISSLAIFGATILFAMLWKSMGIGV